MLAKKRVSPTEGTAITFAGSEIVENAGYEGQ